MIVEPLRDNGRTRNRLVGKSVRRSALGCHGSGSMATLTAWASLSGHRMGAKPARLSPSLPFRNRLWNYRI